MLKKTLWFIRTHLKHIIPENSPLFRMMAVYGMKIRARSAHEPLSTLAMGVFAVEHCNLNCKCCTTFSPIAEESLLNIETFRKDAAKLAEVCGDKVTTFYITGGEPLLHPQLTDIFDIARKYFPTGKIFFMTNGILLPQMPETFWENMQKNHAEKPG